MSGTTANVVPVVLLGVALNVAALSAMRYMRNERHPVVDRLRCRVRGRTEMKVVRTVLTSTLEKIGDGKRRWCLAQQWMMDRKTEVKEYDLEVGFVWAAPSRSEGCDVTVASNPGRKAAIALVQC